MEPINVQIQLETSIIQAGSRDHISEKYFGVFSQVGDDFYLKYQENPVAKSSTVSIITYQGKISRLRRTSEPEMDFIFDVSKQKVPGVYKTKQAGQIDVNVVTKIHEFIFDQASNVGSLHVLYQLVSQNVDLGAFDLTLRFRLIEK